MPEGTRIVGLSGNDITGINCVEASEGGFSGQFKILYPAESIEGQSGSVQLTFTCDSYKYASSTPPARRWTSTGTSRTICATQTPWSPWRRTPTAPTAGRRRLKSPRSPAPRRNPPPAGCGSLSWRAGTEIPLSGAVFEVVGPDGDTIGSFATDANGEIQIRRPFRAITHHL